MSKSNKSSKSTSPASVATPPPAPPPPQGEYYYQNDLLRSQRTFDPSLNAYVSKSFSTPAEQGIEKQATDYIGQLVNRIPQEVNLSPEKIAEYRDAYAAPQINALNDSYNRAKGQADMSATGAGMRNSIGFNNYLANQLEKNRAQGLADIQNNAKMMEYDLPNKILAPFTNQFNLINAALSGEQANMAQNFQPAFQGSQAANNALSQNYQNQLNYWQAMNAPQQGQPVASPSRGGLFSFFTGGY